MLVRYIIYSSKILESLFMNTHFLYNTQKYVVVIFQFKIMSSIFYPFSKLIQVAITVNQQFRNVLVGVSYRTEKYLLISCSTADKLLTKCQQRADDFSLIAQLNLSKHAIQTI